MMKKLLCSLILMLITIGFVQAQQDVNLQGNGNDILDASTVPLVSNHTDFENVSIGSTLTRTFTIQNTGDADLSLTGPGAALNFGFDPQFSISLVSTTSPITGGSFTTFDVTYTPTTLGAANAVVNVTTDDPDVAEQSYTFAITANGIAAVQDVNLQGNGNDILDGSTTPLISNHTDFESVSIGSTLTRTFTIQNTGGADLSLTGSGVGFNFGFDPQFSISLVGTTSPITGGSFTTFDVTYTPTTLGAANAVVLVTTDDPDVAEQSYTFAITANGTAAVQDVNLQGNGNDILDGSTTPLISNHTDFENVGIGSTLTRTFTIQNTGGADLSLTGAGATFNFGFDPQFSISLVGTTSPITGGSFTTFDVTYTPTTLGAANAVVNVTTDDPDAAEQSYTFAITANGIAAVQDVNLQGNGNDILDGSTTPLISNHTDFESVSIGSTLTRTFTIQNTGGADLSLTGAGAALNFGFDPQFSISLVGTTSPITGGSFTTFDVTYTPTTLGAANAVVNVTTDDPDVAEQSYTFAITANGIATGPDVNLQGNGNDILDGSTTPLVSNHTDFEDVGLGSTLTRTFTIQNTGVTDLNLTGAGVGFNFGFDPQFSISLVGTTSPITGGSFTTFNVTFTPTTLGVANAVINVTTDDPDVAEQSYTFAITANGVPDPVSESPLLITQYYEGVGVNDNWIEVKNISGTATLTNAYHLALYEDLEGTTSGFISSSSPTVSVPIPGLTAGGVVLFRRSGATLTNFVNTVTVVDTEVCRFNGNDIILISSSNGSNTYNDRIDIMGIVGGEAAITWAVDIALIKGCGTDEVPAKVYDPTNIAYDANQYIQLTLNEVEIADLATNIALGRQTVGPTTWISSWDNDIPDKTKNAIINGTYNNSNGSFDACNLTVNSGSTINLDSGGSGSNYILVENDLTVNGTFTIGDTESLITVNPDAVMTGSINKIEVTTTLNNFRDFTYWSSPVNTTIGQAFAGVDPNRIFKWDIPTTSPNFWGDWSLASGTMTSARGFISEAPSGTPVGGTHTVTFTGTPNNGTEGIVVGWNNDGIGDSDFNLIGNPYPSAINIDNFIQSVSNNDIDGTIWLWTHNTAIDATNEFLGLDYATYNLTGGLPSQSGSPTPTSNIGSGQGFFVKSVSNGPVFFENTMRLQGQNTQFFRAPGSKSATIQEKDRVWLKVESNTGGAFSEILIGFFENATDGFDRGYDGTRLGSNWINFYSKIDTVNYAIQGLGSFNADKKVSLGFDTYIPDAMTYKISIDNIEGALNNNDLYLVDNELNIVHDLKLADYEFDVNGEGIFPNRFTMQFNSAVLGINDLELDNDFVVINEENALTFKASSMIEQLKVYDMMGRLLIDKEPNNNEFSINTSSIKKGTVLIVNVTFDNGSEVSKKAIKY